MSESTKRGGGDELPGRTSHAEAGHAGHDRADHDRAVSSADRAARMVAKEQPDSPLLSIVEECEASVQRLHETYSLLHRRLHDVLAPEPPLGCFAESSGRQGEERSLAVRLTDVNHHVNHLNAKLAETIGRLQV